MDETFINPYTFVPLPRGGPQRDVPHGHEGQPELLSGKLPVRITTKTPLLVRGFGERDDKDKPANTLPRRPDGKPFIPGSSCKGAIRSLHETLTGSCLRVFDSDFVPSYRDSAVLRANRVLAVVTQRATADEPPKLKLCKKGNARKHRLHQDVLRRFNGGLCSGQRLNVLTWEADDGKPKIEKAEHGQWVLFVSDVGPREPHKPYHAHIREISDTEVSVPVDTWETFLRVVEDTDDRRTQQRTRNEGKNTAPVVHRYKPGAAEEEKVPIGERYLAGPELQPGQPVWVDEQDGKVTWLGLAMNWRQLGSTTASERAGAFNPCDDPQDLCPSCRLLGSIDPKEREKLEAADQLAYRGHIRFGDALADGEVEGEDAELPPMGAPRPGAGQAYLNNTKLPHDAKDDPALRQWGAPGADGKNPRPLRGRKQYWQAAPNGREQAREHHREQQPELVTNAEVFPEGTEFQATITFTDVDEAQLGSLIAALQPSLLLDDSAVQTHIGGGKPLGFGQCSVEIAWDAVSLHHNGARYGADQPERDLARETTALIDAFRESVSAPVKETWPLINRVLRPDGVPAEVVWYPPGARWKTRESGQKEDLDKFDEGFEFWKQTAGFTSSEEAEGGYPLTSLPQLREKRADDDGSDQAMNIVEKDS